ncbi:MAG: NAD(P)-binding domain-containing protein [Reichenbachiella sp.]
MSKKILIIDDIHDYIIGSLSMLGYQLDYRPGIAREKIQTIDHQYVGLIVRSNTRIDEDLLANQKKLKFVARAGAGLDQLDMKYLESRDIQVINAGEGNRDALGEHVIGMLLSLSNNLRRSDLQVRDYTWKREENRGFEIGGKTVGLLGYGHMGSAVAEKLAGFGCRVIAYDKYKSKFSDLYVEQVDMGDIFEQADIFSLHVPLTKETRGLVDADYLSKFKKDIIFVNAARGEVVNTQALLDAIDAGAITHAALDVLENEKMKTLTEEQKRIYDQLFAKDNVLFSPHIGGWSFESYKNISKVLANKIAALSI